MVWNNGISHPKKKKIHLELDKQIAELVKMLHVTAVRNKMKESRHCNLKLLKKIGI